MNSNWAEWSIKHKQVIHFFATMIAIMGIICYAVLGRQEDPSFPLTQMVISASWPGATAKQMEMHVADKIEKVVQTVDDLDYVTSYSRPGVCVINVYLKDSIPSETIPSHWLDLRNRINDKRSELPAEMYGPFFNDHFDDVFGNVYAVTSDSFSYEEMRKVASRIKDNFVQVPDVKKVDLLGVQPEKIYLQVDNEKLAQLGLSVDQLAAVVQAETSVTPAPMKYNGKSNIYLRLTGIPDTVENIENIPVSGNGRTLRLRDIAKIERGYAEPAEPKMYFNGKPAVGVAISMVDGGNNLKLGENLDKKVKEIRKMLPLGFEFNQVLNQPKVVKDSIDEFVESLVEAILIVLVVSLMTLGRQSGYVISVCIPLVLMCSMIGMFIAGIDLHKLSLGALIIALGMLVDDSVVVVEMIETKINEGWDRIKACSFAFESCAKPLLTGTMITCASFMPIAFARSQVGAYAGSLFTVITITLMSSWLVSATVAPTLAHAWLKKEDKGNAAEGESSMYQGGFYDVFRKLLNWSLHHRVAVILISLAIFAGSLLLSKLLKEEFFPVSTRPELIVDMNLPEGSSLKTTDAAARKLTEMLLKDEDVSSISTYVGVSSPRFVLVIQPEQPRDNYAQLIVVSKGLEARQRLEKKVKTLVDDHLPDVQSYCRTVPLGPPTPYPVMFRVSAPDDNQAKEYAEKIKEIMVANPHVTMVRFDWMEKAPAVRVELDDDKLRQMGLTRKAVASALYAEVSGYSISKYYEGDQAIDMVFRLEPKNHQDISDLGAMSIPTAKGIVQLNQVAYLSYENEDGMIWRRNLLPTVTVNAGIIDSVTGNDVTKEIWEASAEMRKNLPFGVNIEIDGPSEKSAKSLTSILRPVPFMLIIMLVLLMIMLMDVRKVLVVMCISPLGLIGVFLGLFLFNTPLSLLAQVGTLALVGTIIRNGTVLVDQIDQHMAQGMPQLKAVTESVIVRFRPIMLTALTTVLGLVPMFPSDFWRGMALAISCGLTVATVITLVVLPVIYCMVFKVQNED